MFCVLCANVLSLYLIMLFPLLALVKNKNPKAAGQEEEQRHREVQSWQGHLAGAEEVVVIDLRYFHLREEYLFSTEHAIIMFNFPICLQIILP